MTACDDAAVTVVRRGPTYEVARTFGTLSAAMAGVEALGSIPERAYAPPPAPPLSPVAAALAERQIEEPDGLKAGEAHEHDRDSYLAATAAQSPEGS